MGLFDNSNDVSGDSSLNAVAADNMPSTYYAADIHNVGGTGSSAFENATDWVMKGIPAALVSGFNSIANTGISIANWMGADMQENDTYKMLQSFDDDTAQYYARHKEGADLGGFIATSFIPGTLGIKALKAAQLGRMGETMAAATNIFAGRRDAYLAKAMTDINAGEDSLFGAIKANKMKAIAMGFGDQALQSAAFETAVAATMNKSPLLDKDNAMDMGKNILWGALTGGVVGGAIEGAGIFGKVNQAVKAANFAARPYETMTDFGRMYLPGGDRILATLDDYNALPATAETPIQAGKLTRTKDNNVLQLRQIANKMAGDDAELGNAFMDQLLQVNNAVKQRTLMGDVDGAMQWRQHMEDMLLRAQSLKRVDENAHVADDGSIFYFYPSKDIQGAISNGQSPTLMSRMPPDTLKNPQAYKLAEGADMSKAQHGTFMQFNNADEAWQAGMDTYMSSKLGISVNPKSSIFVKANRPAHFANGNENPQLIFNLRTGEVSETAYATVGDLAKSNEIAVDNNGLRVGDKHFANTFDSGLDTSNGLNANARYVWADKVNLPNQLAVSENDLPLMERLLKERNAIQKQAGSNQAAANSALREFDSRFKVADNTGAVAVPNDQLADRLLQQKQQVITDLANKGKDMREIAQVTNVDRNYIESGFKEGNTTIDPASYTSPNHAVVSFDAGSPLKDADGMLARGMQYLQYRIQDATDRSKNVFANFAKDDAGMFPNVDANSVLMKANQKGVGASFLGASNAEYATEAQKFENIGKSTAQLQQKWRNSTFDRLQNSLSTVLQDPQAAAELGTLTEMGRGTEAKYMFHPDDANFPNTIVTRDYAKALQKDMDLRANGKIDQANYAANYVEKTGAKKEIQLSDKVADFLQDHTAVNDERLEHFTNMYNAVGRTSEMQPGTIYWPAIDTRRYPYFAFVRQRQGVIGNSSRVGVITAPDEGTLVKLMQSVPQDKYQVITKKDSELFHQVKGDYDYDLSLHETTVNSDELKEGKLYNFFPKINPELIGDDYVRWHGNQVDRLVRNMVELNYSQPFAELRQLGSTFTNAAGSIMQGRVAQMMNSARNPYEDYIKTALNLSRRSEYRLWNDMNEKVEALGSTAWSMRKQALGDAADGKISWEDANKIATKYGLGTPYKSAADVMYANTGPMKPYLSAFVNKVNSVLAVATLQLDTINSLVNIISTPIMLGAEMQSIRTMLKNGDNELSKAFNDALSIGVPGTGGSIAIPSTTKLIYNAIKNYFEDRNNGLVLLNRYRQMGVVKDALQLHHDLLDTATIAGNETPGLLAQKAQKAIALGTKWTGNNFAEEFTRFVSADAMRQVGELANLPEDQINTFIHTFVNRVQGNYLASQRPIAFQGVIGQAIGLFQTYQFNLMQQLFRYVEAGDKKAAATLLGLQSSIYGLQGVPAFQALNTHIIGNADGNPTHKDLYTATQTGVKVLNQDIGNWLMYGFASNLLSNIGAGNLYSRGDINPRQVTVLPTSWDEVPGIAATMKVIGNLYNMAQRASDGGNLWGVLTQGLEHNGISRPLAGLAQVMQGYSTTSKGSLISASNDMWSISNMGRVLGAKPFDESIALDALYRTNAYQAKDRERLNQLGEAIKTNLVNNQVPSAEQINDFATKYAAYGGNIQNFSSYLTTAMLKSNASTVNLFKQKMNNPIARNMQTIMGGEDLTDFRNNVGYDSGAPTGQQALQ